MMTLGHNDAAVEKYRRMLRIRYFETRAEAMQAAGEIAGALHTCSGQEGEIVGACVALRTTDYMVGNHRSHGHPIAKGAALGPLMAELLGRATGVCKGKGGSMHLSDFSVGSLGETSIVGSGLPVAVGAALGSQMQRTDQVTLCFFGDGATSEGAFHEALNLAALWKLPVIFMCENNGYAISTPVSSAVPVANIADRAAAYAMPGWIVDGQDVDAVELAVGAAVALARDGGGPTLIEAKTYRYGEHAANMGRILVDRKAELATWRDRDPIALYRVRLADCNVSPRRLDAIESEVAAEIDAAVAFARESPEPDLADAFEDVFDDLVIANPHSFVGVARVS